MKLFVMMLTLLSLTGVWAQTTGEDAESAADPVSLQCGGDGRDEARADEPAPAADVEGENDREATGA